MRTKGVVAVAFSLTEILWFVFLFMAFLPLLKQQRLEIVRLKLIRQIELKRKSRLITLIHRQESISILGIPISRYINIEDSEAVLRAIRLTPDDMPIDLVLHTPGGLVLASEQIARALQKHPAKVTVFVPHYAMSGGTMIALAADEIVMDENAVLGPVDPQLGEFPAVSVLEVVRQKGRDRVDDRTLMLAEIASKAVSQVKEFLYFLLSDKMEEARARELAELLASGTWTHDYPIDCEKLKEMGLPVTVGLMSEIYYLMDLYPQPPQRRPSVQFIPLPYGRREDQPGRR
ncbi:Periplasmic serine proteases [Pelotomaculum thermopropionicum SI]|uniref:Periplasmic serine proteases n=1 Tax=Pelotomaculum thermopropionicum (strain DSM 13744 / JCM 10971 / SI) TaxID=370438 RepID=A5D0L1_PELTS|nr:Periplasmic serine proteases [Pelotomaculum thermopropionicum SI]